MSDDSDISENPLQAAAQAQRLAKAGKTNDKTTKLGRWSTAGLGAAIGSAAVVAALLYINHHRKKDDA